MRTQATWVTYVLYWLYTVIAALLGTLVVLQVGRIVTPEQVRRWGLNGTFIGGLLIWQINGVGGIALISAGVVGGIVWYVLYSIGQWRMTRPRVPRS